LLIIAQVLSFLIFLIEILSTITPSVEPPMTPSVACPNLAEPSHATQTEPNLAEPSQCTQTDEPENLANPNPMNEFVGIDDEGLYIDLGPQHPVPLPVLMRNICLMMNPCPMMTLK
jgi:hypothetical protein